MKKFIAAALSASMIAGMLSGAVSAQETGADVFSSVGTFSGSETAIQFRVTDPYGGEISASLTIQKSESGDVSVSGSAVLPADEEEGTEEQTVSLDDLVRVVAGDMYLNVDAVMDLYQEMTGDASLISLAAMVGITEPWIVIPKLDIPEDAAAQVPAVSEEMAAALQACFEPFEITETQTGAVMSFDRDSMIAFAENVDVFASDYEDELMQMMTGSSVEIDYKTVFADYIQAAAEGINAVSSDVTVEDGVAMINSMIDSLLAEAEEELEPAEETPGEGEAQDESEQEENGQTKFSDQVRELFDESVSVNGTLTVDSQENSQSVILSMDVADEDGSGNISLSIVSDNENGYAEITVPDSSVALRDIVKNVVIIYYGMMSAEEETAAAAE